MVTGRFGKSCASAGASSASATAAATSSVLMVLRPEDGLGGIAHGFDRFAGIQECDDAARAALEAFVAPREGPDQAALVEQELDIAAQVLGVQQALLEG